MIEYLLLVSALIVAFAMVKGNLPVLQTRRSGKAPAWVMGALLFIGLLWVSIVWLIPIFEGFFGFAGALVAGLISLGAVYVIYAFLVKKTGAKPTL